MSPIKRALSTEWLLQGQEQENQIETVEIIQAEDSIEREEGGSSRDGKKC